MKQNILFAFFALALTGSAWAGLSLRSPDGKLSVKLLDDTAVISYAGAPVVRVVGLPASKLDASFEKKNVRTSWMNPIGERREVTNAYSALIAGDVEFRAYDAGFAWKIANDASEYVFTFSEDARCWPVSHAQGKYEPYKLSELGKQTPMPGWAPVAAGFGKMFNYDQKFVREGSCESPLVVEPKGVVVALGDAAVYGGARLRFLKGETSNTVKSYLEGPSKGDASSWKYVRVAKTPAELYAGNDLLLNLSGEASTQAAGDSRFLKGPGKVLRLAKLDTQVGHEAVDFIKAHNIQYLEIDCGWYGQEHTGDPTKPGLAPEKIARGEKFDLFDILAYAKAKDVPVILYVNRAPLMKNHVQILDTLKSWGVAGVKYGFLHVGSAKARAWAFTLIQAAQARGLLVDIHDEMRLTGEQRTYPNLMTVEGICGNEEMPTADHNAALVFTRYLTGPGDYTPCWTVSRIKTTLAHQLALAAAYYSPWQFLYWYQKPSDVKPDPALTFWDEIPTVWDETKILAGEIGKFAVVARRSGDKWFVGGVNGLDRRTLTVDPSVFGEGNWKVRLFVDDDPSLEKGYGAVKIVETNVTTRRNTKGKALAIDCAARGGFSAIFEK